MGGEGQVLSAAAGWEPSGQDAVGCGIVLVGPADSWFVGGLPLLEEVGESTIRSAMALTGDLQSFPAKPEVTTSQPKSARFETEGLSTNLAASHPAVTAPIAGTQPAPKVAVHILNTIPPPAILAAVLHIEFFKHVDAACFPAATIFDTACFRLESKPVPLLLFDSSLLEGDP